MCLCLCVRACWPGATLKEDPTGVSRTWEGRGDRGAGDRAGAGLSASLPPRPEGACAAAWPPGSRAGREEFRHMFSVHWTGSLGLGHSCRNDLTWLVFCPSTFIQNLKECSTFTAPPGSRSSFFPSFSGSQAPGRKEVPQLWVRVSPQSSTPTGPAQWCRGKCSGFRGPFLCCQPVCLRGSSRLWGRHPDWKLWVLEAKKQGRTANCGLEGELTGLSRPKGVSWDPEMPLRAPPGFVPGPPPGVLCLGPLEVRQLASCPLLRRPCVTGPRLQPAQPQSSGPKRSW